LQELKADAKLPNAPEQLRSDLSKVLDYFGIEKPEDIGTEHHEKFARAVETYFMEGKSPTKELADVFQRFKAWLTKIYRTVSGLGAPVSDDLRGVFDRMLATDEEISHAQQSVGVFADEAQQKFRDKLSGLMTKAEFAAYEKAIDKANTSAHEAMLKKMMEKITRERTRRVSKQNENA
jgi:molecular chaperone GrpE (heat shock protein)